MQSSLSLARISCWTNNLCVDTDFYVCISVVSVIGDILTLTPLRTWVVTVIWWFMHSAGSRAGPMMPAACIVTGYCLGISESASFTAVTSHEHQPVPRQLVKKTSKLCITGPLLVGTAVHRWIPSQRSVIRKTFPWCAVSCRILFNPRFISVFSCDVSDWLWIDWDPMSWVHVQMGSVMSSYYHKHNGCRCCDVGYTPSHQQSLSGFKYIECFLKHNAYMCRYISRMYNRSRLVDARPSAIDMLTKRWIYHMNGVSNRVKHVVQVIKKQCSS